MPFALKFRPHITFSVIFSLNYSRRTGCHTAKITKTLNENEDITYLGKDKNKFTGEIYLKF